MHISRYILKLLFWRSTARFLNIVWFARVAVAIRTTVIRPVPVILAELKAEQLSSQSATDLQAAESSDSTMSATGTLFAGSESSAGSSTSSSGSGSASFGPGSNSNSFDPTDLSASARGSSSFGSSGMSGTETDPVSSQSGSKRKKKPKLPETDVFGEPPHTSLSNDEVDLVARHILATARKARCAGEDEYCNIEFKNCKDEQCRRQVESQSSLSSSEKKEISKLLQN